MSNPMTLNELTELAIDDRQSVLDVQRASCRRTLATAWAKVPFYAKLWRERFGDDEWPAEAPEFEDWPTWSVTDLRKSIDRHPPFGDLYLPEALDDIVGVFSSTGTTGRPRPFPVTRMDSEPLTDQYRRFMSMLGIGKPDLAVITATFGLPRGAWSWLQAFQSTGTAVIGASSGRVTPPDKLLDTIMSTGVTVIQATGSYLSHITRRACELGIDLRESKVRAIVSGGESASPALREYLTEAWGASFGMMFASTDVSWIAVECAASVKSHGAHGMHVLEDLALVEVLDGEGQQCAPGQEGEVVISSWVRPSTPRIRFRTGDRAAIVDGPCSCGLTGVRLMPITGRVDEAVRFHGQTIWASAVEQIVLQTVGSAPEFYLEQRQATGGQAEQLVLALEQPTGAAIDGDMLADKLRSALNVRFNIELLPVGGALAVTGVDGSGKTRRVLRS